MFRASTVPVTPNPPLARRVSAEDHVTELVTECNRPVSIGDISQSDPPGWRKPDQEGEMFATHATAQDVESARMLLVVIAGVIVIFWRTLLRVLIAVLVAALLVGVGAGVLMLFPGIHP